MCIRDSPGTRSTLYPSASRQGTGRCRCCLLYTSSLHSFNLYLIAAGYTKEVVLDKQDYLKVQLAYASPSTVSREEVERFRQEILERSGVRDYAIVTILAYAGLRISECLALRVEDISLPAREIKVRHGKGCLLYTSTSW